MKLPANGRDSVGMHYYTDAGQAEADLTSARMALDNVLQRRDLTRAQQRGVRAALSDVTEALLHLRRHVDINAFDGDQVVPALGEQREQGESRG